MKKVLLLIAAVLMLQNVNAQILSYGIKAGINTTTDVFKNGNLNENYNLIDNKAKVGFQAGGFARITLLGFFVQPEIYYSQSRTEVTFENIQSTSVSKEINKMNTLNVPILVGYKIGPARINVGPVATFLLSSNNIVDNLGNLNRDMKTANWGFQAGFGLDVLKIITLDARYESSFTKAGSIYNSVTGKDVNFGARPQQFLFTLGIFL